MAGISTISNGRISAAVDSVGAQLMSLCLNGEEYLWQRDEAFWPRCAPVLFPIVGSLREDRASSAQGEVYLGRHGLARIYEHELIESSETSLVYQLESSEETRAAFPFDFRLNMAYAIKGEALEQRFIVTNTGKVTLPFVVGGHPAFNVPAPGEEGASFSDYRLVFSRPWSYASPTIDTSTGLLDFNARFTLLENSDTLPLTHSLFDVDTLTFEDVPGRTLSLMGPAGHGMRVDFEGFDYLGVWSAPNAPFVALEPWRGCATALDEDDTFENKRGMDFLEPGESAEYAFSMQPL